MNINLLLIREDKTILDAVNSIEKNKKGFVIIESAEGECVGVLTDGDIRRSLIRGVRLDSSVREICGKSFSWILEDSELNDVIDRFADERIKFLPVLDNAKRLVNVITKNDLHALLMKDIQPDMLYDFSKVDTSSLDQDVFSRPWGFYKTIGLGNTFRTKIINVRPKAKLSLQSHESREEYWVIVKGEGTVVLDKSEKPVCRGSIIYIPNGCRHRIKNTSEQDSLVFIEVQQGDYLEEDDIIRYEDEYGRVE